MANKVTAYLALGSNIDDRMAFLAQAETFLKEHSEIEILKASKIYETEPWPKEEGKKWFLNQVIQIKTALSPQELLEEAKSLEVKIGRTKHKHWGPREIDIDILLYGDQIIDTSDLQIPHRHIEDRQFILVPLIEIASTLKDPLNGRKFSEILKEVQEKDSHKVTPFL